MLSRFSNLIDVKSIVTITMTCALVGLMFFSENVNKDILMLFSSTYGSVITYFFTKSKTE